MIKCTHGDILRADVEAIVNTVNCVGVMGRGIALQFKKTWPDNFKAYAEACRNKEVQPGKIFLFATKQLSNPRYIINFPTKRHWRDASRIEDIDLGLADLTKVIKERRIQSIAIPPLGAGLGGLNWQDVKQRIESTMQNLPGVEVIVYEPERAPASDEMVHNDVPRMTAGRNVS